LISQWTLRNQLNKLNMPKLQTASLLVLIKLPVELRKEKKRQTSMFSLISKFLVDFWRLKTTKSENIVLPFGKIVLIFVMKAIILSLRIIGHSGVLTTRDNLA